MCLKISVIGIYIKLLISEKLFKHEILFTALRIHSSSVICDPRWKLFRIPSSVVSYFPENVCNLSHKRAGLSREYRSDSIFLLATHKMAVHLLFEMFLYVLDWKITVFWFQNQKSEPEMNVVFCLSFQMFSFSLRSSDFSSACFRSNLIL